MYKIKEQLQHSFDWIIGIAKGGVLPALYLSYITEFPLDTLCVSNYEGEKRRTHKIFIEKDYAHIKGKKILIVDDLVDSGDTMKDAISFLEKFNPSLIQTAVIYKKKDCDFAPDYFIYETPHNLWIDFYWEDPDTYGKIEGTLRKPTL